ncbi:hypothetical protein SteCoe_15346 [Stentor coeruleus]|uniref:Uncharacterized protein n=1 Tax=Stentor coeruleus TaxID=5963 RepID=A0A1R2C3U1_9CILI|nr:hypothetical protein SteCoe_15346 [Stentor coeruleus]
MNCFYKTCQRPVEFACKCAKQRIFICNSHLKAHKKEKGFHCIEFSSKSSNAIRPILDKIKQVKLTVLIKSKTLIRQVENEALAILDIISKLKSELIKRLHKGNLTINYASSIGVNAGYIEFAYTESYEKCIMKDFYKGVIINGKKEGIGILVDRTKKYIGEFKNDKRHGKGLNIKENGEIYDGEWLNDKYNGKGNCTYSDGHLYEGQFLDNLMDGYGVLTYPKSDIYEGNFKKNILNGDGKYYYHSSGEIYEGKWRNGIKHGAGVLLYPNNARAYQNYYKGELVSL